MFINYGLLTKLIRYIWTCSYYIERGRMDIDMQLLGGYKCITFLWRIIKSAVSLFHFILIKIQIISTNVSSLALLKTRQIPFFQNLKTFSLKRLRCNEV